MANEINEQINETIPSYLLAGASHTNLNNGAEQNQSVLDAASDVVTKWVPLALGSGVSQLYNIVPTIGNWGSKLTGGTGKEFEMNDFSKTVQEFDSDLSKYYTEHQMGTDALGFVLGSLVPGMAGVKVLNAGQKVLETAIATGKVGTGPMGKALGLLAPTREAHVAQAVKAMSDSGNVFKLTEANTLRALASGVGQNALEGAVFTAVVNATMYESPVLEARDVGDLTFDVLTGAVLGGVVGGAISGVISASAIKKGVVQAEKSLAPFGVTDVPRANMPSSDRILFNLSELDRKAELDPNNLGATLKDRAARLQDTTRNKLLQDVRSDFQALTGDDSVLASVLNDSVLSANLQTARSNLLDAKQVSRMNAHSAVDMELSKIRTKLKEAGNDLSILTPEESNLYQNTKVSFVKLKGEGAGQVTDERPGLVSLADRLGPGETIKLHEEGIQVGSKVYAQTNNVHQPFNLLTESTTRVQSRYAWARLLPKWDNEPGNIQTVHINDIPLLSKALDDAVDSIRIMPESGLVDDVYSVNGKEAIKDLVKRQKAALSTRMVQMDTMPLTAEEFAEKASSILGINFNLVGNTSKGFFTQVEGVVKNGKEVTGDVIALSANSIKRKSLMANIAELKKMEGHSIFQALVDSSGVAAQNLRTMTKDYTSPIMQEVIDLSKARNPALWNSTKPEQIARRRDPSELFASAFSYLSAHPERMAKMPEFNKFAGHLVRPIPQEVLDSVATRVMKPSFAEIAEKLDMQESILRGVYTEEGMFARATAQRNYDKTVQEAGRSEIDRVTNIDMIPSYARVLTDSSRFKDVSGQMLDSMTTFKQKAVLYDQAVERSATQVLGERIPGISDEALLSGGNSGPGLLTSTEGNYGSRDAWSAYVGQRTHDLTQKRKSGVSDTFNPSLVKVGNDPEAAIEFSLLNEKVRSMPGNFVLDATGTSLKNAEGVTVPITSPKTQELVRLHIQQNGKNVEELRLMRSVEGTQFNRDSNSFYPIPRNLKDTPHFAMVLDNTVTGTGHSSMIYAKDGATLEALKQKVLKEFPEFKVLTRGESEEYFKSQGKFEYTRTINQNYIDTALARKGISSSMLPITDPQKIVNNFLDWHLAQQSSIVREAVSHRFGRQLDILRAQAEPAISASKSTFGYLSPAKFAETSINNPATNTMKQLLDIQKMEEFPVWTTVNKTLDEKFSEVSQNVSKLWDNVVHPDQLTEINSALTKAGYKGPVVDEALYEAMNGTIPRGTLTGLVAKMNALLGSVALRMDPMNAANNVIGHAVLYGTEAKAVIDSIKKGSKEGAGELAALSQIRLPGTDDYIFSHQKVLAKSFERLRTQPELKEYYKKQGFITSIMDQYDQTLDHIAIRAGDNAKSIESRMASAVSIARGIGNTAERLTGNKLAEEFNRFLAADFMKQITDVAVKHGVMDEAAALPYINSFVNRTQGNFLASQRPVMFQGPIGQAIGLFQTYQFNLIQQLMRHVGDGNSRNAMAMMGMQGTIFGLNGLPAFNAINTHIVGNAGGNSQHADIYQAIFNGAGKEAGEWLAYGAMSNALGIFDPSLKTNLYSRGDVNPRSLTLVPTDPAKVPIVQATAKFFGNIKDSIGQLSMGADLWPTILRAVEHNGLNRPLAGIAQVFGGATNESGQVVATNAQGNILMNHDLLSLVSAARVLGAKPMDESMVQEAMFRINSYRAHDATKRQGLGEAIKTNILGGGEVSQEELDKFSAKFVAYGGKQEEFNQFMSRQYRNASVSQAEQLRSKLTNSYGLQLQHLMGGDGADSY